MSDSRLDRITSDAYDVAESAAIDLLRSARPSLDMRAGTAVRALVVGPGAIVDAALRDDISRLRTAMSIQAMQDSGSVPVEDASAVLSNFGIELSGGSIATGYVRVVVTSPADNTISSGTVFRTQASVEFVALDTVRASVSSDDSRIVSMGDGTYYFVVQVRAVLAGSSGNIEHGTALTPSVAVAGLVRCDAYSDFTGGSDGESIASGVARIPSAIAYRGLTNTFSTTAVLESRFKDTYPVSAVSCVGYRSRAMLRDKHNDLGGTAGISIGGRVDVYVRTFSAPRTVTFLAAGELVSSDESGGVVHNSYKVRIPDEYRGFYAVKCVSRAESGNAVGSLAYELVRAPIGLDSTWHDISASTESPEEIAWSSWQAGYIVVHADVYTGPSSDDTRFRVDLYYTDGVQAMQAYVDSDDVCNVAADHVVRNPPICLVSVRATAKARRGLHPSSTDLEEAVASYINGISFTGKLTRSELANVLLQHGVESVDLGMGGMQLSGRMSGADGLWYEVSGDTLDVSAVGGTRTMLTADTVVFAAEPDAVQITVV